MSRSALALLALASLLPLVAVACGSSPDDGATGQSDDGGAGRDGQTDPGEDPSGDGGAVTRDGSSSEDDGGSSPDGSAPDGSSPDGGGSCPGTVELCDGAIDDNCDGQVDEGCGRCPLMTIACPQGCCAVDRWQVSTAASDHGSSIAVDAAGNIFFAYTKPSNVWGAALAVYDAVPGTWRTVELENGTYRNRVLLDAQGRLHVLFGTFSGGYGLFYKRSDDGAQTFSSPSLVGTLAIGAMFDMALDSTGRPHVVFGSTQSGSSFPRLTYAKLDGASWVKESLDLSTTSPGEPELELGFMDRPYIVVTAYEPEGENKTTKRIIRHNGNRWIYENLHTRPNGSVYASGYFTGHSLRLLPDGSSEVMFTLSTGATSQLLFSHRGPGDLDPWSTADIPSVTNFIEPTLFTDQHGRRAAVSNGLSLHRENANGTWSTTALGVPGQKVAQARRGRFLYLGYSDPSAGNKPTFKLVDLGP